MDFFRSLKYKNFNGTERRVKTYSLSKCNTYLSPLYGKHSITIDNYYSKRDCPSTELEFELYDVIFKEIQNSKHTYLLWVFREQIYRKNKQGGYEYFDDTTATWVLDDEMDDEWLEYCLPHECMFKIKA